MSGFGRWPPSSCRQLEDWMTNGRRAASKRIDLLNERKAQILATIHQPVTAKYSQVKVARNSKSDPTFRVVEMWIDLVPNIDRELDSIRLSIRSLRAAVAALPDRERDLIRMRFDSEMPVDEIATALSISRATFYRIKEDALASIYQTVLRMSLNQGEQGYAEGEECGIESLAV